MLCKVLDLALVVTYQKNRHPFPRELPNRFFDLFFRIEIQGSRRLVQQEDFRLDGESPRQSHPLGFSSR